MPEITIRLLTEEDVPAARRISSLAFGTFLGLPEPEKFGADVDYVGTRRKANPAGALAIEADGVLVGSNLVTNCGSVGYFGPLTVLPHYQDQGIGSRLMEATMELFAKWSVTHAGLLTFAQSPKHIGLYEKYGFWPRFLTAMMSKPVSPMAQQVPWSKYSEAARHEKDGILSACHEITNSIYSGLDVSLDLRAAQAQKLGDTVLMWDDDKLAGFAICHCGPGTEAGTDKCRIKFGAVRPAPTAGQHFDKLLDACEAYAISRGMTRLSGGTNLAREDSYVRMKARGFRTDSQAVAMQHFNKPGYNRPDVYVIDDWR